MGRVMGLGELCEPMQTCNRFEPHEKKTPLLGVFLWGGICVLVTTIDRNNFART